MTVPVAIPFYIQWREGMSFAIGSSYKGAIRLEHKLHSSKYEFQVPGLMRLEHVPSRSSGPDMYWVMFKLPMNNHNRLREIYISKTKGDALKRAKSLRHTLKLSEPEKVRFVPTEEPDQSEVEAEIEYLKSIRRVE